MKTLLICSALLVLQSLAPAQVTAGRPTVRAVADATIISVPDQAKVSFSVDTQARTAQDAASQNAAITSAVIGALKNLIATNGEVRTSGYSVYPIYSSGAQPTITGFTASNTVEATVWNLSLAGKLIDSAMAAGANRVQSLAFSLKDPEPVRLQALRQAAIRARAHADAMATGAGMRVGSVVSIVEGAVTTPIVYPSLSLGGAATGAVTPTPIETGNVSTTATVTIEYEIAQ